MPQTMFRRTLLDNLWETLKHSNDISRTAWARRSSPRWTRMATGPSPSRSSLGSDTSYMCNHISLSLYIYIYTYMYIHTYIYIYIYWPRAPSLSARPRRCARRGAHWFDHLLSVEAPFWRILDAAVFGREMACRCTSLSVKLFGSPRTLLESGSPRASPPSYHRAACRRREVARVFACSSSPASAECCRVPRRRPTPVSCPGRRGEGAAASGPKSARVRERRRAPKGGRHSTIFVDPQ